MKKVEIDLTPEFQPIEPGYSPNPIYGLGLGK